MQHLRITVSAHPTEQVVAVFGSDQAVIWQWPGPVSERNREITVSPGACCDYQATWHDLPGTVHDDVRTWPARVSESRKVLGVRYPITADQENLPNCCTRLNFQASCPRLGPGVRYASPRHGSGFESCPLRVQIGSVRSSTGRVS